MVGPYRAESDHESIAKTVLEEMHLAVGFDTRSQRVSLSAYGEKQFKALGAAKEKKGHSLLREQKTFGQ